MRWPREIVTAFMQAVDVEMENGTSKEEIIVGMLDLAARRMVWRAGGDPARVEAALRSPYTPLGSATADGLDGTVRRFTLKGDKWGPAVQAWYAYIEANAAAVFAAFQDEAEPYDDSLST
jgi:hypothetical protein